MEILQLPTYNIYAGDCRDAFPHWLADRKYSRIVIITDENTHAHCLPHFLKSSGISDYYNIIIPAGEQHKHIETCTYIWSEMLAAGADRRSLTINLGGGVIGDMGGFCASTFKRGMDFVQVPTTLLSQVDASIGGKLGIDFHLVKNCIGVFTDPQAVFVDPAFLQTLSYRELRSGFAEVLKHSLIADASQWQQLQAIDDLAGEHWHQRIVNSLLVKKAVVEEDPFEKGIRKALNYGHTIGHAVEGWALHSENPLLHGEAIAIGMICEAYLSHLVCGLDIAAVEEITQVFLKWYEPNKIPESCWPQLHELMQQEADLPGNYEKLSNATSKLWISSRRSIPKPFAPNGSRSTGK